MPSNSIFNILSNLLGTNVSAVTEAERQQAATQYVAQDTTGPVDSDVIDEIDYDANTKVLDVKIDARSGIYEYKYFNVRPEIADVVMNPDEGYGEAFNDYIKGGFYAFYRVK